jgi:drug/metabolite transporter (DMT)-like permease
VCQTAETGSVVGMVSVVCALGAALLYAAASVLQQRAAAEEPAEKALRLGLLARLVRRPMWLLGVGADVAAFALQFVALAEGAIVIVQPLLVAGLLFALPFGARFGGGRLHRRDLMAALAVCAGLALFLTVADPANGHAFISGRKWALLLGIGCGTSLVLAVAGQRQEGRRRALLLSASAGVVYGVAAGLTKTTGHLLAHDVIGALGHWEPYALAVVGIAGMVIGQSAFQAGSLDVSLPTMSVVDPVVSVLVGALAFGEAMSATPAAVAAEVAGLAVTTVGVYLLARSPVIRGTPEHRPS